MRCLAWPPMGSSVGFIVMESLQTQLVFIYLFIKFFFAFAKMCAFCVHNVYVYMCLLSCLYLVCILFVFVSFYNANSMCK